VVGELLARFMVTEKGSPIGGGGGRKIVSSLGDSTIEGDDLDETVAYLLFILSGGAGVAAAAAAVMAAAVEVVAVDSRSAWAIIAWKSASSGSSRLMASLKSSCSW